MQVPVTLFDLIGAARHTSQTIEQVYEESYVVGVLPLEGFDWIKSVALKLKKPCPFLTGQGCGIYDVRPLPCMLFPEYQAVNGTLGALTAQVERRGYLCLRSPLEITKERARALRALGGMLQREVVVSDFHLFGRSPLWVDFSGIAEDLAQSSQAQPPHAAHEEPKTDCVITPEAFDRLFRKTFLHCEPLCSLDSRVRELDRDDRGNAMIEALDDKKKVRRLLGLDQDRPRVWTYMNGAIEERRQSLTLREHMFL